MEASRPLASLASGVRTLTTLIKINMDKLQTELIEKCEEVSAERYDEMLGVLPPERMAYGGFLVGEPTDHGGEGHAARYALYITEKGKYYYAGLATCKDFDTFTIPAWRVILADEISKELDTDTGVLRAYWSTGKRLKEQYNRKNCLAFVAEMRRMWGDFKANEMRGDFIDAGIISLP